MNSQYGLQEQQQELQSFLQLAESLDGLAVSNNAFFQLVLDRRIPQQLASYMTDLFRRPSQAEYTNAEAATHPGVAQEAQSSEQKSIAPESAAEVDEEAADAAGAQAQVDFCASSSQQWSDATKQPGLLYALQLLTALVKNQQVGIHSSHFRSCNLTAFWHSAYGMLALLPCLCRCEAH